jgi:hypothetical protein
MPVTTEELVTARETSSAILEELGLETYIFEVEPQDAHFELKVECACETNGGWVSITLTVPREEMLAGFENYKLKRQLFEYWSKKLAPCKRKNT